QVRELIKFGALDNAATPDLAEEEILSIVRSKEYFREFVDKRSRKHKFPLSTAKISTAYKHELFTRDFSDVMIQRKIESREITVQWHGSMASYSGGLTPSEEAVVEGQVQAAIAAGRPLKTEATYVDMERVWARLSRALRARESSRGDVIDASP